MRPYVRGRWVRQMLHPAGGCALRDRISPVAAGEEKKCSTLAAGVVSLQGLGMV